LDRENVHFWLDFGTLLCAYRDEDLTWEHDTDISIFVRDYRKIQPLENEFRKKIGRFDSFAFKQGKNPFYHCWGDKIRPHGDVLYWYPLNDYYVCWGISFFKPLRIKKLSDIEFMVPARTEEYLEWVYGKNWKTPMSSKGYAEYQKQVVDGLIAPYPANISIPEVVEWKKNFQSGTFDGSPYW
jgi:hypothetical protein